MNCVYQEGPLLTEDLIKENEEFVLRTGRFVLLLNFCPSGLLLHVLHFLLALHQIPMV